MKLKIPVIGASIGFLASVLLVSCIVGVDENGDWSIRPDPRTIDVAFEYLIRKEVPVQDAKSDATEWVYQLEDGSWVYADGTPYEE